MPSLHTYREHVGQGTSLRTFDKCCESCLSFSTHPCAFAPRCAFALTSVRESNSIRRFSLFVRSPRTVRWLRPVCGNRMKSVDSCVFQCTPCAITPTRAMPNAVFISTRTPRSTTAPNIQHWDLDDVPRCESITYDKPLQLKTCPGVLAVIRNLIPDNGVFPGLSHPCAFAPTPVRRLN